MAVNINTLDGFIVAQINFRSVAGRDDESDERINVVLQSHQTSRLSIEQAGHDLPKGI